MIHVKRILLASFLFVLLTSYTFAAYAQGQRQLVMDCEGKVSACPYSQGCECKKWIIKLLDRSGKEWGQLRGNSLESVKKQLENSQKWEEDDSKFFDISNKGLYSNPSDPICGACMNLPKRSQHVVTSYNVVEKAFDYWVSKLNKLRNQLLRGKGLSDSSKPGDVLKGYVKTLQDANMKLRDLEKQLNSIANREPSLLGYGSDDALIIDLNYLKSQIEGEEENVDRAYDALPRDIRELLERQE